MNCLGNYISIVEFLQSEMDPYSLWEDEDTRIFYESLTDLKTKVPSVSDCKSIEC